MLPSVRLEARTMLPPTLPVPGSPDHRPLPSTGPTCNRVSLPVSDIPCVEHCLLRYPPHKQLQVYYITPVETDPLLFQQLPLQVVTAEAWKGYLAQPVYYPVPGQLLLCGARMQYPGHLPGPTRITGSQCNSAVCCYLA